MFLPWNRGIKTLVEQSSATTQTSTVATFVRRFFGAPGSAPQIINNFKAGDQNQPKQPWKDFRHLSKWSREEMRRDCEDLALIEWHNFVIWQKTSKSRQLSQPLCFWSISFLFFGNVGKTCRSERQDWHWFSTQTAAVSSPSCFHACQPQYHNQILHGLWEVGLYDRQEAGHVR